MHLYKRLCRRLKYSFRPVSLGILSATVTLAVSCESKAKRSKDTAPKTEINTPESRLPEVFRAQEQMKDAHSMQLEPNTEPRSVRAYDVEKYELEGHFDWNELALKANLRIVAKPLANNLTSIELDSKVTEILSVTDDVGKALNYSQDPEKYTLTIELGKGSSAPSTLKAGPALIDVRIKYIAKSSVVPPGEFLLDSGLRGVIPDADDPVQSRVAFTQSEPLNGRSWLPANHSPHDRAVFSVALDVDADETLIANGDFLGEEVLSAGRKRMRYQTRYTLPTYVMAFAVGQLEKAESVLERKSGALPVSVWKRRGYPIHSANYVSQLKDLIAGFESKLVPYPFEKYAVVLLPKHPFTALENASITFIDEVSDRGFGEDFSFWLNAHEMAHQWFGDLVTVSNWDDLWIKEGMATLLTEEAKRFKDDLGNYGGLFGYSYFFNFSKNDAVIDRALPIDKKYTSGPYARAGWVLNQIRHEIGEDKFWSVIRGVLTKYAFGHINTEEFLNEFAPALGAEKLSAVRTALEAKGQPKISLQETLREGKNSLELSVEDPHKTLITTLDLEWVNSLGEAQRHSMKPGVSISIPLDEEGFVVLDPREVHPEWSTNFEVDMEIYTKQLQTRFVSPNKGLLNAFLSTSPAHQIRALRTYSNWNVPAVEFPAFIEGIDSITGKMEALKMACNLANQAEKSSQTVEVKSWSTVLDPIWKDPAVRLFQEFHMCPRSVFENALAGEFESLRNAPEALDGNLFRYLLSFDRGAEEDFATWKLAFESATSNSAKIAALFAISRHLNKDSGYTQASDSVKELMRSFYLEAIKSASYPDVILRIMYSLTRLKDTSSWTLFAQKLKKKTLNEWQEKDILCFMKPLADEFPAKWEQFQQEAQPWESHSEVVQKILKDRVEGCK